MQKLLTRGGVYLLRRSCPNQIVQCEDIVLAVKKIISERTLKCIRYFKCACEDGVGDEIRAFVEVKDGSRIRVGDFIAITEYIVDTKKDGSLLVMVTNFHYMKKDKSDEITAQPIVATLKNLSQSQSREQQQQQGQRLLAYQQQSQQIKAQYESDLFQIHQKQQQFLQQQQHASQQQKYQGTQEEEEEGDVEEERNVGLEEDYDDQGEPQADNEEEEVEDEEEGCSSDQVENEQPTENNHCMEIEKGSTGNHQANKTNQQLSQRQQDQFTGKPLSQSSQRQAGIPQEKRQKDLHTNNHQKQASQQILQQPQRSEMNTMTNRQIYKPKLPIVIDNRLLEPVSSSVSNHNTNSNTVANTTQGGQGTLSDKLNKRTLSVRELSVGIDRHSFKFEGKVTEKSSIKSETTPHFFIKAQDLNGKEINISFWGSHVTRFDASIQVGKSYYFLGAEANNFKGLIELKFKQHDCEVIEKNSLELTADDKPISVPTAVNSVSFTKATKLVHPQFAPKRVKTIKEVIGTSDKYVYTEGTVMDVQTTGEMTRLIVSDDRRENMINVILFQEMKALWLGKISVGMKIAVENFVRALYGDELQLKSNRQSSIRILQAPSWIDLKALDKDSSENDNTDNEQFTSLGKLQMKNQSSKNLFRQSSQQFNKVMTLKEVEQLVKATSELSLSSQQKINFIVYANILSIQRNKMYYLRCPCSSKAALKFQNNTCFCETCQNFITPVVNLMLSAFLQDATSTIPVMIFDPIASSLINKCNPEISMEDAAQVIKNMYESDNEEALCSLLSNLDYKRFRFEVLVEHKEFNQEQEISYKVQRIEENINEESQYLLAKLDQLEKQQMEARQQETDKQQQKQ